MSAVDATLYKITKNTIISGLELGNNISDIIAKMEKNVAHRRNLPQALKEIAFISPQHALAILSAHSALQLLDEVAIAEIIVRYSHDDYFWNKVTTKFLQLGLEITQIAEKNITVALTFLTTPLLLQRFTNTPDVILTILARHKDNPNFTKRWHIEVNEEEKIKIYENVRPGQGHKLAKLDHLIYILEKEQSSMFSLFRRKSKQEKIAALTKLKNDILTQKSSITPVSSATKNQP